MKSLPIDLHLEVCNLKDFINDQIYSGNPYSFDGKEFYEILKRVVIDAEVKPFLTFPKDQNEQPYYDNYRNRSNEEFQQPIPDFFEYEGEFYDLERIQYVYKEFTRAQDFEKLFLIKILELKSSDYSIVEFLSFQKYDSFFGEKESIDSFLYQLTEKESNCHLLQDLCQILRDWIGITSLETLMKSSIENQEKVLDDTLIKKFDAQDQWENGIVALRGKQIKCKWSLDQIVHYFSFLYKEKSENGDPYLTKEQVDKIFENGFRIPDKPIAPLFKPNCNKRYPLKNITFAINEFYKKSHTNFKNKRAYFTFFASFIEGYTNYLISPEEYKTFSSNTSNSLASRTRINWNLYLPSTIFLKNTNS